MSFGENLQVLRKQKNLSQEKLADDLDVSRQCISKWEMESAYPETEKLLALSEYFNVSIDTLLKGNIEMNSELSAAVSLKDNPLPKQYMYRNIRFVVALSLIILSPFWTAFRTSMQTSGMPVFMFFFSITIGFSLILYNYLSNPKKKTRKIKNQF